MLLMIYMHNIVQEIMFNSLLKIVDTVTNLIATCLWIQSEAM